MEKLFIKELAKRIRDEVKQTFGEDIKFSITKSHSTVVVSVMESKIPVYRDNFNNLLREFDDYQELSFDLQNQKQHIQYLKDNGYEQLNPYYLMENRNLSNKMKITLIRIKEIFNKCNYYEYYINFNIGKWNKPFKQLGGTQ